MRLKPYLIFGLILPFLLSGCWDLTEVDRRVFATTVGIDAGPNHKVILNVQVPQTEKMLPPGTSGGNNQGNLFSTISFTAATVNGAFGALETKTHHTLVIHQNKSIIIGEDAARLGTASILDFLTRSSKAPPQALVFVTDGVSAEEVLKFTPIVNSLPGIIFIETAQAVKKYDRTFYIPVWQFYQKLFFPSKDPYAPLVGLDHEEGRYIQSGLAVFNGDQLAGTLSAEEAQIFGLISGLTVAGQITLPTPKGELTIRNLRSRVSIKVRHSLHGQELPIFYVNIKASGSISELTNQELNLSPGDYHLLEKFVVITLQPKITTLINKLKTLRADVIGFGEALRVQQWDYWQRINWKEIYPQVPYEVEFKIKIISNGIMR